MTARFSIPGLSGMALVSWAALMLGTVPSQAEIAAPMSKMRRSPTPLPYKISSMKAFLFLRESGTWHSQDLFTAKGLWNTTIGEGIAGEPSNTASLLVQLEGVSFKNIDGKLDVVAVQNKRRLLVQTAKLQDLFSPGQSVTAAFLVNGVGCGDVVVTATLRLPKKPVAIASQRINFECGQ